MIHFDGLKVKLGPFNTSAPEFTQAWKWRNDERIWKWCRQRTVLSWDQHEKWGKGLINESSIKMFCIYDINDVFVGVCGFTDIDNVNRRAEFSLYIGPQFQGKGFAKDALSALFGHGFHDLGFNSIWGETFDGNPAIELFYKLGMKLEGTRRQFYFRSGKFIDCHLVGITRAEWESC